MKSEKEQLTFIEVFSIISLASAILSALLSWMGFIPGTISIIFAIISIKLGEQHKFITISKISFIIGILGLLISITALILFGLSSANIISKYWGSFPYIW